MQGGASPKMHLPPCCLHANVHATLKSDNDQSYNFLQLIVRNRAGNEDEENLSENLLVAHKTKEGGPGLLCTQYAN
jgi:hypothetical protein